MRCEKIMSNDVECCAPTDSAQKAAARMRWHNVGFLPVIDEDGRILGTITDRDLAMRVLADGSSAEDTKVAEVMSTGAICCRPHDPLAVAEKLMIAHRKSRIVCIDERDRPVGIVSLSDVAEKEWTWRSGDILRSVTARESRHH